MISITIDNIAEHVVKVWQKLYKKSPRLTVIGSFLLMVIASITLYFTAQATEAKREAQRQKNASYTEQTKRLQETRENLQALMLFIESEQRNLASSQQALQTLKHEHEQLRPLVESDRETVNALFIAQEARNKEAQKKELWIGFALGVASSLFASLVIAICSSIRRRNN